MIKHVYENVLYYKKRMEEKGVKNEDTHGIEGLHKLLLLTKTDQSDAYHYGILTKPMDYCVRIKSTSGTT